MKQMKLVSSAVWERMIKNYFKNLKKNRDKSKKKNAWLLKRMMKNKKMDGVRKLPQMDGELKLRSTLINKLAIGIIMAQSNKKQVTGRILNQLNKKEIILGVSQRRITPMKLKGPVTGVQLLLLEINGQPLGEQEVKRMTGLAELVVKQIMIGVAEGEEMNKMGMKERKKVHALNVEKKDICHENVQINNLKDIMVVVVIISQGDQKSVLIVVRRDICLRSVLNQGSQEKVEEEEVSESH